MSIWGWGHSQGLLLALGIPGIEPVLAASKANALSTVLPTPLLFQSTREIESIIHAYEEVSCLLKALLPHGFPWRLFGTPYHQDPGKRISSLPPGPTPQGPTWPESTSPCFSGGQDCSSVGREGSPYSR